MSPSNWSAAKPLAIGILALMALVLGFGVWATRSQLSGAIVAPGKIEVAQNRQVVQHPDGGVVRAILVQEGAAVQQGDILVQLDDTLLTSDLSVIQGQLYELMARRGRLEAERDSRDTIKFDSALIIAGQTNPVVADQMAGQVRLFQARRDSLANEIAQLDKRRKQIGDQIDGIDAQIQALKVQSALLDQQLDNLKTLLAKGLAQASRLLDLQREQAKIGGAMGDLQAQRAQAQGRITELEIEKLKQQTQRHEQAITRLRDLQYQEQELSEKRRALLNKMSRLNIRAPVAGVVYDMQVFANQAVIRPADPVLYIVPQNKPLVISARIAPIHIDEVYLNQPVSLRFSTLEARTTPELFGHITKISADAFQDEITHQSYYRAEIELNDREIDKLPAKVTLLPGMPVEAFMRTATRTPLEYLVKPLADYFAKALKES